MKSRRVKLVALTLLLATIQLLAQGQTGSGAKPPAVHSVILTWLPSPGATSYNIYRGTVSGGPYVKIGIALNPTYTDTPVPSGAVFYYVATTVQGKEESNYSKEIKASVP